MSLRYYMDHNVQAAITDGLRARGIDCLTAAEDGTTRLDDESLFRQSTALGRVLFTEDSDLLVIARQFQATARDFAGLVFARQLKITFGRAVQDLEMIAVAMSEAEIRNQVVYIPI